jgi:hypothetical protein
VTVAGLLEPTPGYARREFAWLATVPGEGVLVVRQRRTWGGREDAAVYAVEDVTRGHDVPERAFLVVNMTDPDAPEPYEVVVRGGEPVRCTCKAAKCRLEVCKHRDVVSFLVNSGEL